MRFLASVLAGFLIIGAAPIYAANAATSSQSASVGAVSSVGTVSIKPSNATFGAGPANTKRVDGRPYFTYDSSPGGSIEDHIAVINYADHKQTLNVYAVDAVVGTNGTYSFAPRSARARQVGAWIAVGSPTGIGEVTIGPRTTVILPVFVHVPFNASPGDHVGAVIVSLTALVKGKGKGKAGEHVKFEQRIATRVVIRVSGPLHPALTIENLQATYSGSLNPLAAGTVTVSYTVANTGNALLGAQQQVIVQGLFGSTATATTAPTVPLLLPGESDRISVRVTAVLPEISLTAKASLVPEGLQGDVDPGLHNTTASVTVLAVPWVLIAIVLVLVLLVIALLWRRHRARLPARLRARTTPQGATS
jgi:hypothetical protein